MRGALAKAARQGALAPDRLRLARKLDRDLRFCIASARGGGGFIFVRLLLGLFGMDLYEIYWWYGAGLAIVLLNLDGHLRRVVARVIEAPASA